ncbi:hypothetical protein FNB79_00710 [Formosa sediminum]|uniref:DUF3325 domain-containing protein n=1 Tax=Formosa sediminum TaxID=2594004 RepID=A0A516GM08_9FLAO|nr:hypothetical protein [Formosa sediminum]QDO92562.1 hypothetical protein FNB79_00710 [Formosa sediminum]
MITLSILLVIIAFYLHYTTSQKMKSENVLGIEPLLNQHTNLCKILSYILLSISCILTINVFGLAAGMFSFVIYLMTFGSLIILLVPLQLFNYKSLSLFTLMCFVLEFVVRIP